jgi:hypothetical protein
LATDNILKGAKPADLPLRQVMLIALTELIELKSRGTTALGLERRSNDVSTAAA